MPPLIPALLLVFVSILLVKRKASLACEPFNFAKPNPSPKETPLTAGTEKIKWDKMLSTESKKGSPSPAGRPIMAVSKIPPNESPSAAAYSIS